MITYQDINNTVAECGNMGGIADQIYYAPRSFFKSLASKPDCETDREFEGMNLLSVGKDELLPGKQLLKLYNTMEKGSLKAERQGEIDGISHKINLTLFTPGLKSKTLAMLMIANQSWIFYVKTGNQMFRVGNARYSAKMAADGEAGTGDATASAKGNTMSFFTYEEGFAGEVVDIAEIENMLVGVDTEELIFDPLTGTNNVQIDSINSVAATSSLIVDVATSLPMTLARFKEITKVQKLTFSGDVQETLVFGSTGSVGGPFAITHPDYDSSSLYRITVDKTQILTSNLLHFAGEHETLFFTA